MIVSVRLKRARGHGKIVAFPWGMRTRHAGITRPWTETMPNTPSAIKRLKQSQKRRLRNRIAKKIIKTFSKRAIAAAQANETEKAESDLRMALSKIDKAGVRRVLHPNTAARRKSKLTRDYQTALGKAAKV